MNNLLQDWAELWGIPQEALDDLADRSVTACAPSDGAALKSHAESYVQSMVRLAAPVAGYTLWRNNVGALMDKSGRPVRYGLANDSRQLNETIKSGDLIGWQTVVIGPEHVGQRFARFVSIECKEVGWEFGCAGPNTEQGKREKAQQRWVQMVVAAGGIACFSVGGLPV